VVHLHPCDHPAGLVELASKGGKVMSDFEPLLISAEKQFLTRLRKDQWLLLTTVRPSTSNRLVNSMLENGWIECRGVGEAREVRLTRAGFEITRTKVR